MISRVQKNKKLIYVKIRVNKPLKKEMSRKTNRDRAEKKQRPMVEDQVIAEHLLVSRSFRHLDKMGREAIGKEIKRTFRRFLNRGNNIFDRPNQENAKCVFVNHST